MGDGGIVSAEVDGFKVDSNSAASEDDLRETLKPKSEEEEPEEEEKPDLKKAASELGKKGGKAAAKKRKEEQKARGSSEAERGSHTPEDEGSTPSPATTEEEEPEEKADSEEEESEEEQKPSKKGNPRHDPIARMKEATRKEAEAKAEARLLRQQLNEALEHLRNQPSQERHEQKATPKAGRPSAEDFDNFEEYLDARDNWNKQQWYQELQQQQDQRRQQSEGERAFNDRLNRFKEKADFTNDPDISRDILELTPVFMLEKGAQVTAQNVMADWLVFHPDDAMGVARYLSQHEDEFQRVSTLSNGDLVYHELAKIAGRIENAGGGEVKVQGVSKAKPPVKPVSGAPYIADDKSEGPKPGEDFDAWLRRTGKVK